MEYQNYTYEYDSSRIAWLIYDREGRVIADATNETNANLIVECLNGVSA